jgi:hypothetical protein
VELVRLVPVVLLAGGIGVLAFAVATGGASAGVIVVVPFVIGTGPVAILGGALFALGLLTLPWAFPAEPMPRRPARAVGEDPPSTEFGGVALLGPV